MKQLFPDFYFQNVSEISPEFFRSRGITHVIFDIDDTLTRHGTPTPEEATREFLLAFCKAGLTLALISNAKSPRAERFAEGMDVLAISHARKPSVHALDAFFLRFPVPPKKIAFVGDQLFTDVLLSKRLGLYSVLVQPIHPIETPFFYLKRALEKPILSAYFRALEKENKQEDN